MNRINIVFVSDVKTIDNCIVSMLSVLKNKNRDDIINFYFMADEFIKDFHKEKFECLNTDTSKIFFIHVNSQDYNVLRASTQRKDLPNNAYYRLSIADKLEAEEKAIYVDYDTYTCKSLHELYNINIENYYLAAVKDIWEVQRMNELKAVDIKTNYHYNSGMMLLNLKKWREDNVFQRLKEFAQSHPKKFILADQFLINSVIKEDVKIIDYKYNIQIPQHSEPIQYTNLDEYNQNIQEAVIIHYIFGKPWEFAKCRHPLRHKWWAIAREYPYYEELLSKYISQQSVQYHSQKISQVANMDIVRNIANYSKNRFNYYRCKLLSNLTFGSMRRHYKDKKKKLKAKIKEVRRFLKGK